MTRISSKWTFFHKKAFPVFWFGFLVVFVLSMALTGTVESDPMFVLVPGAMALFGFFLMRKLVWDLVDEVYDGGDYLLIRNRGQEERLPLSNIMNVSVTTAINPPRITLRLVTPGRFGRDVAFSPVMGFTVNPFAKSRVAEDLIVRVDRARSSRANPA